MRPPILEVTNDPPEAAYLQLWAPLRAFNESRVGDADSRPFAVLMRDPDTGELVGGLWGRSLWSSFYIDMIVVPEALRGRGEGAALMARAEDEARGRGCRHVWLDTYAFQARDFYEKLGYVEFGRLDGPAPVFPRYFLSKDLALASEAARAPDEP
jgi:GNAT superfamily N-acetyltransferase